MKTDEYFKQFVSEMQNKINTVYLIPSHQFINEINVKSRSITDVEFLRVKTTILENSVPGVSEF